MSTLRNILIDSESAEEISNESVMMEFKDASEEYKESMENIRRLERTIDTIEITLNKMSKIEISKEEYSHVLDHLETLFFEVGLEGSVPSLESYEYREVTVEGLKEKLSNLKDFLKRAKDNAVEKVKKWFEKKNELVKIDIKRCDKYIKKLDILPDGSVSLDNVLEEMLLKGEKLEDLKKYISASKDEFGVFLKPDLEKKINDYQDDITKHLGNYLKQDDSGDKAKLAFLSKLNVSAKDFYDYLLSLPIGKRGTEPLAKSDLRIERIGPLFGGYFLYTKKPTRYFKLDGKKVKDDQDYLWGSALNTGMTAGVMGNTFLEKIDIEISTKEILIDLLSDMKELLNLLLTHRFQTRNNILFSPVLFEDMMTETKENWSSLAKMIDELLAGGSHYIGQPKIEMAERTLRGSEELLKVCEKALKA